MNHHSLAFQTYHKHHHHLYLLNSYHHNRNLLLLLRFRNHNLNLLQYHHNHHYNQLQRHNYHHNQNFLLHKYKTHHPYLLPHQSYTPMNPCNHILGNFLILLNLVLHLQQPRCRLHLQQSKILLIAMNHHHKCKLDNLKMINMLNHHYHLLMKMFLIRLSEYFHSIHLHKNQPYKQ